MAVAIGAKKNTKRQDTGAESNPSEVPQEGKASTSKMACSKEKALAGRSDTNRTDGIEIGSNSQKQKSNLNTGYESPIPGCGQVLLRCVCREYLERIPSLGGCLPCEHGQQCGEEDSCKHRSHNVYEVVHIHGPQPDGSSKGHRPFQKGDCVKLNANVQTNGCGICSQCQRGNDVACTSPLRASGYSYPSSRMYSGVVFGAEYIIADVKQLVLLAPSYHNPFLSNRKSRDMLQSSNDYYSSYRRGLADGSLSHEEFADNQYMRTSKSDTNPMTDSNISTIMTSSSSRTSASHRLGSGPHSGDIVNSSQGQILQHHNLRTAVAPQLAQVSNRLDQLSDTATMSRDWRVTKRLKSTFRTLPNRELSSGLRNTSHPR